MKILVLLVFSLVLNAVHSRELYSRNDGRITNGKTAAIGQFPYQVGLSLQIDESSFFWCGGSLISSEWILTAAHCTDGVISIIVYLGSTVRRQADIIRIVTNDSVIIHEGWNINTLSNDISLIKISPVGFTDTIQKIELPVISEYYSTYDGEFAIASGWGYTSDSSNIFANNLQYGRMQVIDNSVCKSAFNDSSSIVPSVLCVATPDHVSTCDGDSGGPLVLEYGKKVQIGLSSFSAIEGCEMGFPAGFTRVTSYLDWIRSHTGISY